MRMVKKVKKPKSVKAKSEVPLPPEKAVRKNLTFMREVLQRADECMKDRAIEELSDYLATLTREDHDRRFRRDLGPQPPPSGAH
jgi:hypothetical protein